MGEGEVSHIAFGPQTKSFVCCSVDNSISSYSLDGTRTHIIEGPDRGSELKCLVTDGTYVVTGGSDGIIRMWNLNALGGEEERYAIKDSHDGNEVVAICMDTSGKMMISAGKDGSVCRWKLEKGSPSKSLGLF